MIPSRYRGIEKTQKEINVVLEQIRQEIDDLDRHYDNDHFSGNDDAMFKCDEVFQIINKYTKGQTE